MRVWRKAIAGWNCAAILAVAGCATVIPPQAPPPRPDAPLAPPAPEAAPGPVEAYFARLEQTRLAQGLFRQERAPRDLPVTATRITRAFENVALRDEYQFVNGTIVQTSVPAALRRWEMPVRLSLEFSDSVPAARQARDRAIVADYARDLARITDHPMSVISGRGNFHVLVVDEAARRDIGPRLQTLVPGIDPASQRLIEDLPLSVSCLVLAFSRSGTNVYSDAIAVIRAELPDLSRDACYFEEIAQGLGLPNDTPMARPSLFNDAAEFAVLTTLDEHLLRILYDPRLQPGQRAAEATPIVRRIAEELMGGQS
jgi:hypothetical protein